MAYPSRPTRHVLSEFAGTNTPRGQSRAQRERLITFVGEQYSAGLSLRELAELTGRSQSAVRRALDQGGVPRRPRGARTINV